MKWRTLVATHLLCFSASALMAQQGTLHPFGLDGKVITALAVEAQEAGQFARMAGSLFAGTEGEGVFTMNVNEPSPEWASAGLSAKTITALTVQHWGAGPLDRQFLFAAVVPIFQQQDCTLVYKKEITAAGSGAWVAADSGLNRQTLSRVTAMNSYYNTGHTPPQPVLLGGEAGLYWSVGGTKWSAATIEGEARINAIDMRPHWFGELAWAAGSLDGAPAAFRSLDQGQSWQPFLLSEFEGETYAVAINPRHADTVYVGQEGGVLMTPDSGKTWSASGLSIQGITIHAVAVDPFAPQHVFAGGSDADGAFAFFHSPDGGATWTRITPAAGENIATVSTLVVLVTGMDSPETNVFIGTRGTGVWQYKLTIPTGMRPVRKFPIRPELQQNYPNPFNPGTQISFRLAEPEHVIIRIFDPLGHQIRVLGNRHFAAGDYTLRWDGSDAGGMPAPSGVYLCRLQAGSFSRVMKLVLVR